MSKTSVFSEAIAEAKQIRQTAIENAKKALEESMTPKLQRMISQRLQEIEEDDLNENEDLEETVDLNLDEVEDESSETSEDENEESTEETEPAEDPKVSSLTVSELTQIIKDVVTNEMGSSSQETVDDVDSMNDEIVDDTVSMDDTTMDTDSVDGGDGFNDDEEIDLDELMSDLDSINESDDEELDEVKVKGTSHQKGGSPKHPTGFKTASLKEAKVIKKLQKELNEVNLLNSKLLYVNKIFKANNLNETQKMRIIEKFETLTNVKAVKLMYESLSKNLTKSKPTNNLRKQIKENLGFASKPIIVGTQKRTQIVEDASILRMKKLAGIK